MGKRTAPSEDAIDHQVAYAIGNVTFWKMERECFHKEGLIRH